MSCSTSDSELKQAEQELTHACLMNKMIGKFLIGEACSNERGAIIVEHCGPVKCRVFIIGGRLPDGSLYQNFEDSRQAFDYAFQLCAEKIKLIVL